MSFQRNGTHEIPHTAGILKSLAIEREPETFSKNCLQNVEFPCGLVVRVFDRCSESQGCDFSRGL